MSALRFSGPVLPDADGSRDLYVVDGRVTYEPVAGAETVASGWIVPGLVDAHCHLGLDDNGAIGEAETEQQAIDDRDAGALLIRDCGSAADTSWIHDRDDLPRLVRAGRHIARTKRYIRNYAHEVEPDDLVETVRREAQRGDGWVKLVGDWISRDAGDLAPSFSDAEFAAAIEAAHAEGAKVTAHCFGNEVLGGLIEAGIDCIEHGTGLTPALVEQMAGREISLVPTVMQLEKFPDYASAGESKFPDYAATMTDLHQRRRHTIMSAYEAGVALFAGSDGGGVARHGNIAGEVQAMAELGLPREYALGAASWRARRWLGFPDALAEGDPADLVVYDADPLNDLSTLNRRLAVVLRGQIVAGGAGA